MKRVVICLLGLVAGLGLTSSARADFGVTAYSAQAIKADLTPDTRAGGHPWGSRLTIDFKTAPSQANPIYEQADERLRELVVDLPKGFVGNPQAVPQCEPMDLAKVSCSPATQVGVLALTTANAGSPSVETFGVFNMKPQTGDVADLGFYNLGVPFHIRVALLPNGYTVRATVADISEAVNITNIKLTLWGDPASPIHDPQRGSNYKCPRWIRTTRSAPIPASTSSRTGDSGQRGPEVVLEQPVGLLGRADDDDARAFVGEAGPLDHRELDPGGARWM